MKQFPIVCPRRPRRVCTMTPSALRVWPPATTVGYTTMVLMKTRVVLATAQRLHLHLRNPGRPRAITVRCGNHICTSLVKEQSRRGELCILLVFTLHTKPAVASNRSLAGTYWLEHVVGEDDDRTEPAFVKYWQGLGEEKHNVSQYKHDDIMV